MKRIAAILTFAAMVLAWQAEAQEKRMAVVELSAIYMRQQPDYEAALETQELMGTVVEICSEDRYWREIISPQPYRAWTTAKGLVEMSPEQLEAYMKADKLMFTGTFGHLYEEPSEASPVICDLVCGDLLRSSLTGKGKIRSRRGWTQVTLPSGRKGYVRSGQLAIHKGFRTIAMGEGDSGSLSPEETEGVIRWAEKLMGSAYLWGGMSSKGSDCSGLVRLAYLMNGILLPRNASQQLRCGEAVELDPKAAMQDRIINLQRGDLLFFGTPASSPEKLPRVTHIGIYLGEGMFIHSSQVVRRNSLLPDNKAYYENSHRLVAARRL